MFDLAPISTRNQFGQLLNERGLTGYGVEIGTHRGVFAKILLSKWKGKRLHCIDPWENLPGYEYQAKFLDGGGKSREDDYRACVENLKDYRSKCTFTKATSMEVVQDFGDETLDFAYIDGDHSYQAVKTDLEGWWPKLKLGGVLAGHDIIMPGAKDDNWGDNIQHALYDVFPFNVIIYLVAEEGGLPWSYYIIKES
jgi:hypothetical protein